MWVAVNKSDFLRSLVESGFMLTLCLALSGALVVLAHHHEHHLSTKQGQEWKNFKNSCHQTLYLTLSSKTTAQLYMMGKLTIKHAGNSRGFLWPHVFGKSYYLLLSLTIFPWCRTLWNVKNAIIQVLRQSHNKYLYV